MQHVAKMGFGFPARQLETKMTYLLIRSNIKTPFTNVVHRKDWVEGYKLTFGAINQQKGKKVKPLNGEIFSGFRKQIN